MATLDAIFAEGLKPGWRKHVHLSGDKDAAGMHAAGHGFWQADNGVWLVDTVPPAFIGFA